MSLHLHKPYERCDRTCEEPLPVAHYQPVGWAEDFCSVCRRRWAVLDDPYVTQEFDQVTCTARPR